MFGYTYPYIPDATRDLKQYIKPKFSSATGTFSKYWNLFLDFICCRNSAKTKKKYEIRKEVVEIIKPKMVKKADPPEEKVPTILDQWKPKQDQSLKKKPRVNDVLDEQYITDDDDREDDYSLKYQTPLEDLMRKAEQNVKHKRYLNDDNVIEEEQYNSKDSLPSSQRDHGDGRSDKFRESGASIVLPRKNSNQSSLYDEDFDKYRNRDIDIDENPSSESHGDHIGRDAKEYLDEEIHIKHVNK